MKQAHEGGSSTGTPIFDKLYFFLKEQSQSPIGVFSEIAASLDPGERLTITEPLPPYMRPGEVDARYYRRKRYELGRVNDRLATAVIELGYSPPHHKGPHSSERYYHASLLLSGGRLLVAHCSDYSSGLVPSAGDEGVRSAYSVDQLTPEDAHRISGAGRSILFDNDLEFYQGARSHTGVFDTGRRLTDL